MVDFVLFPLDTVKTRLQSSQGFRKAGGFSKIYSGLGSAMAGSAPNAALFFLTYETVKTQLRTASSMPDTPTHMIAASLGEMVSLEIGALIFALILILFHPQTACLIRVPVEVIKQRSQATSKPSLSILRETIKAEGLPGMYRGYLTTVFREIPFSIIQFPLWEYFKSSWSSKQGRWVDPWQSTICGAVAGGIAAAATTPLDVAKTRIMLASPGSKIATGNLSFVLQHIYRENGMSRYVFFGTYKT